MVAIETPCIRVCVVDPALHRCVGCGRTLDEIARWVAITNEERSRIMAELPPRLVAMTTGSAPQALPPV